MCRAHRRRTKHMARCRRVAATSTASAHLQPLSRDTGPAKPKPCRTPFSDLVSGPEGLAALERVSRQCRPETQRPAKRARHLIRHRPAGINHAAGSRCSPDFLIAGPPIPARRGHALARGINYTRQSLFRDVMAGAGSYLRLDLCVNKRFLQSAGRPAR